MRRLVTLFSLGVIVTAAGCGRPFAIVGSGGSGGESTGAGAAGGVATGTGGTTPACTPGEAGTCGDGKYCESATSTCVSCAASSDFHFSDQLIDLGVTPPLGDTAFFPRLGADGTLYFTYFDKSGSIPRRRLASAPPKGAPGALAWGAATTMPPPFNSDGQENGPLFLHDASMLSPLVNASDVVTGHPVLLFDSNRNGVTTFRIFAANLDGSDAGEVGLPSNKQDTDIAAAPEANTPRFYWLSDEGNVPQHLVTATASSGATAVPIQLEDGCSIGNISAPWVTPDGKHLFFAASSFTGPNCTVPSLAKHLYIATMTDGGTQVSGEKARRIFPDDKTSFDDTPALTPDGCMLLFSRFDASTNGHLKGVMRD